MTDRTGHMGNTLSPFGGGVDAVEGVFGMDERLRFVGRLLDGIRNAAASLPGPRAKSSKRSMPRFSCIIGMPWSGSSALMRTPAPIPGISLETFSMYELP